MDLQRGDFNLPQNMDRVYASTSALSPWCYVNKQSIRIRKLFKDFVFLWSSQKGDGMNEINNWVGTWGVGIRDVVLMRHILEVAGCLKNEKGAFILLHFITHILFILNRKGETPRSDIQYHRRAREPFPYREYMLYFLVTSILLAAFFIFCYENWKRVQLVIERCAEHTWKYNI